MSDKHYELVVTLLDGTNRQATSRVRRASLRVGLKHILWKRADHAARELSKHPDVRSVAIIVTVVETFGVYENGSLRL